MPSTTKQRVKEPRKGNNSNLAPVLPAFPTFRILKAVGLLCVLGVYTNISQLALSPVYGSIPPSIWHSKLVMTGAFLGWSGNKVLQAILPVELELLLPLMAGYIPLIQGFMYAWSEALGAEKGAVITESITLLPLVILTAATVATDLHGLSTRGIPQSLAHPGSAFGSWAILKVAQVVSRIWLADKVGSGIHYTRMGMEIVLGGIYALLVPSKLLFFLAPALFHTALYNEHVMSSLATHALNDTLKADDWILLDRKESLTGYVSVLENLQQGFRVMRCDHSLLGGEWVVGQGRDVAEPVYGVFAMLEAVRLVNRQDPVYDTDASCLAIGLGVGTTPSALVRHGIDTTVVEIDPAVHEFAAKYFDLQENNPIILRDAVEYTSELTARAEKRFDYIVHDVFTGGAEPVSLFTAEFLRDLSDLLLPSGVVAINYAGDLSLPTPQLIVRTVLSIFPTCRIFRESPPDATVIKETKSDLTNMVIFCHKSKRPLRFREAVEGDFLKSGARKMFLQPRHEVDITRLLAGNDDTTLLRRNNTRIMDRWHLASAVSHWKLMRTVIPAKIWELW